MMAGVNYKGYRRDHSQYDRKAHAEPHPARSELIGAAENPIVKLETSEGDITVVLFADKSPKTVENFLLMLMKASTKTPSSIE